MKKISVECLRAITGEEVLTEFWSNLGGDNYRCEQCATDYIGKCQNDSSDIQLRGGILDELDPPHEYDGQIYLVSKKWLTGLVL